MRKLIKKNLAKKRVYYIFLRYIILLLLAFPNLWLFYFIFTPLTIYPIFFLLKLFFPASLIGSTIIFNNIQIHLIKACIAGSAYYLLLILNMTTPMPIKKRFLALIFSFSLFLIINILRIFFFSMLLLKSFSLFNLTHLIFWYFLSSLMIFSVWFLTIKIFNIREIPVYSDFKFLYSKTRIRRK